MKVQVCDFSNKLTKEQERKIKTKRRLSLGAESRALGFVGGFFVFVFGFFFVLFCFVFLASLLSIWDLTSPGKDGTHTSCRGSEDS